MKFWAYLHQSGHIQLKRWWDSELSGAVIQDAKDSPFVQRVVGPFEAKNRDEALRIAREKLYPISLTKKQEEANRD